MYIPKRQGLDADLTESPDIDNKDLEDIKREQESASFLRRPSNNQRIEEASREYSYQAMKLIASENEEFLDRDILIYNSRVQQKRNYGLLSLPFSILFFFLFAASAFQHEDVTNVYVIEYGLRNSLGKGAADITNIKETWAWLSHTLFPAVFQQRDLQGNVLQDRTMWSRVLTYNTLQGPLFLEQFRATREICEKDKSEIANDMYCFYQSTEDDQTFGRDISPTITAPTPGEYGGADLTLQDRKEYYDRPFSVATAAGRRLRIMNPTYSGKLSGGAMTSGIASEGVFRAMFFPNSEYELIKERLQYLYDKQWIDKQTKHINIRALFLNVEMGRPRLQSFKLTLSFARSGDVFTKLTMDTIFLKLWHSWTSMAADFFFTIMLLIVTVFEIRNVIRNIQAKKMLQTMRTGWFMLQWAIIVVGWCILLGYQYTNMQLSAVTKSLEAVQQAQADNVAPEKNDLGAEFHDDAGKLAWTSSWLRLFVAQYHLLLMVRFFVAFRAQPRLGVVVNTLEACMLDILHFMVILIPTFSAYAISGCFIFGRRLEEFSNIAASMGFCFKILTETEYDWPALAEEHFWTTVMWIWTFMLFLALLMLNMVLAIILDVYSEQRKLTGKSETINETVASMYTIFKNRSRWVSTSKMIENLSSMNRMISREEFIKQFPGMPEVQVESAINEAQQAASNIHAGPEQMKHTMRMAMALKVSMDKVADDIDELDSGSYAPAEDDATVSKSQPTWITELAQELASQNHAMLTLQWRLQQLNWAWQAMDAAHGRGTNFDLSAIDEKPAPSKIL